MFLEATTGQALLLQHMENTGMVSAFYRLTHLFGGGLEDGWGPGGLEVSVLADWIQSQAATGF